PVDVLHTPALWQASGAAQVTGAVVCVHDPAWQVLMPLHALPSSQLVPLPFAAYSHCPVDVLHTPALWQASGAAQLTGAVVCTHTPAWQVLTPLHRLAAPRLGPLPFAACSHCPLDVLHTPASWQ